MYLMYVDECGDCGLVNSPTGCFGLSGIVLHELRWRQHLDQLIAFRRRMKTMYGLRMREEIHARQLLIHPGPLARIAKHDRLAIIRAFADEIARMPGLSIINVVIDKTAKPYGYDVFSMAWTVLFQRLENGIANRCMPGPQNPDERGMVFPDNTDNAKLTALLRKMRRYNPVPGLHGRPARNMSVQLIVEDPSFRDSGESYFMQVADLSAFLLYQNQCPCTYIRQKGARNYLFRLRPVLHLQAARSDPDGIVRICIRICKGGGEPPRCIPTANVSLQDGYIYILPQHNSTYNIKAQGCPDAAMPLSPAPRGRATPRSYAASAGNTSGDSARRKRSAGRRLPE